jgi:outer membrane receptor for ferrienterochelin and colicins
MYLPHYAGFIEQDVLVKTKNFFELNSKIAYKLIYSPNIEINLGVNNIFNAFQSDLDQGPKRDSGYIYGPARPRTAFVGLDVKI